MRIEDLLRLRDRAIAAARSGIIITDASRPDNPIIDVNPSFVRMTGYTAAEAVGRNCRFLQGPGTDPAALGEIRAALAEGRECTVTLLNYRRDRTPFWNELHISPVRDEEGRITHFVGVQTDVTDRKQAEERARFLIEASEVLASSLDYATTLQSVARLAVPRIADWCTIDMLRDDGGIERLVVAHEDPRQVERALELNRRYPMDRSSPFGPAQVLRTSQPELAHEIPDSILRAVAQDQIHLQELRRLGFISFVSVPLIARDRALGVLTFATAQSGRRYVPADLPLVEDLARRVALAVDNAQLFGQAQRAIRARDQFLSIAAHELRTPVASIRGYAQLLLRRLGKGTLTETLPTYLRTIEAATDRLTVLTDDLLDVSRIRLGNLPLRPKPLDLCDVVGDIAARYEEVFGDRHPVDVETSGGSCRVVADADRVEQVLSNLMDNAAKYSPNGGTIRLLMRGDDAGVTIEVRDAGIGLPPGSSASIFEPFGRAENAVQQNLPGLGLGLYICRSIIERHGGRIWATSEGEGRGTTVGFWIPAQDQGRGNDTAMSSTPATEAAEAERG